MENDLRLIGGLGGLYLLAEPGELSVSVYKRDRHEGNRATDLRAILLGPDRMVLDEVIIQGNDQATLTTQVESRGVYVVNVTAAYDRYGDNVWWGFSTTSSKYLVETSRGHKDARHVEPITLGPSLAEDESDLSYDICFLPSERGFTIELEGLSGDEPPSLFDSQMRLQGTLDVAAEGTATLTVPPTDHEPGEPWCLHLPDGASQILIDGVTQWEQGDRLDNLSLWSPNRASFFPLHDLRWALTPYAHVFHAESDTAYEVDFRLHNNGSDTDTLRLTVESDALQVSLSEESITVAPGEAASITARAIRSVNATVGETAVARLIVTSARHPEFETWSRLEARSEPVTSTPVELPLVYRPYEHENAQFGYTPDYPNDNQMYFGPDNTAWIRANDGLHRYTSHQWDLIDTIPGKRVRASGSKIAFGNKGEVCLLAASTDGPAYLYSADAGKTFSEAFTDAPKSRTQADIEQFAGHNLPAGPAPFVVATQTGGPDPANFWRRVNDLNLYLPEFDAGSLTVGEPIPVSQQAIGISSHSGIPSAIASAGDRVHVIWGEATDPDVDMPGVPAFVATWDRSENRWLGAPSLVGYGPPANDVHNTPSLVIDSEGYLHTLTGTHGSPFAYARSLAPHTAHEGFTEPVLVEEGLRSTYVGLVCGPDDTLHLVFRAWKDDGLYHPHSHYANLGYKRKTKDGEWEPMQRLAVAPFSEYSIWYHRLTIDRRGRLFVSFDIWSTFWFYRTDHVGQRRKTIMSPDGGDTWQLLQSSDLGD
ncbi:MAG: hypothetical protein HOM68_29120 [Gemmatimonadetes bacterium]|nr:hypothetical protein [Gemmatimonadota bacterium]MBT5060642.1 hypothetical protein [Gemmatimonadota bacterium]MBT5141598.1 hypothetical protein [Gemmatimonadota bacterium]MBT5590901.1 hypothetical protein [Gemmatimonadota bacterium]MBT5965035.1 hypothetical protein [Gemmatimonadota bacterium]